MSLVKSGNLIVKRSVTPLDLNIKNKIEFVNSSGKFTSFLENIHTTEHDVIGLDCEWKPVRMTGQQIRPSILQFATRHKIFILDLIRLRQETSKHELKHFNSFFMSKKVQTIRLGFAFKNDAKIIRKLYQEIDANFHEKVVNLDEVALRIARQEPHLLEISNNAVGLKALTQICLRHSLDKSDSVRLSNWEARPLSQKQLEYAALDAYVLIKIYDYLNEICVNFKDYIFANNKN